MEGWGLQLEAELRLQLKYMCRHVLFVYSIIHLCVYLCARVLCMCIYIYALYIYVYRYTHICIYIKRINTTTITTRFTVIFTCDSPLRSLGSCGVSLHLPRGSNYEWKSRAAGISRQQSLLCPEHMTFGLTHRSYWLAVKELRLSYHNSETVLFTKYPYSGNVN